jgi:hypothetical protein
MNSFTTCLHLNEQLHNLPPSIGVKPAVPPMRRAPAPGGVPQASRHPSPCQAGGSPQRRCPGTSCPLLSCQRVRLAGGAGDGRRPRARYAVVECPMPPLDRLGQLGLPSDHTREHLVKQVPLSWLFSVLREEAARETRGPAPRRVLGSGLAYQVRGDTDAPAVGTRCRCAPACHQ